MTVTLLNARTDLRSRLDELSAAFWSDAQLNTWLNQGATDLSRKGKSLQTKTAIPVVANTQQYVAPNDLLSTHRAEFLPTGSIMVYPLEIRLYAEMDSVWGITQNIESYYPTHITQWQEPPNTYFVLFPVPSSAGTLNVFYFRTAAAAANDNSNLDVPQGWEDLPVLFALYSALFKDRDPRWKEIRQLYQEEMAQMIAVAQGYTDATGQMSYGAAQSPLYQFGAMSYGGW